MTHISQFVNKPKTFIHDPAELQRFFLSVKRDTLPISHRFTLDVEKVHLERVVAFTHEDFRLSQERALEEVVSLNLRERLVLNVIVGYCLDNEGLSYPTFATIAQHLGCSEKTVQRAVIALYESGLIKSLRRYKQSNIYRVHPAFKDEAFKNKVYNYLPSCQNNIMKTLGVSRVILQGVRLYNKSFLGFNLSAKAASNLKDTSELHKRALLAERTSIIKTSKRDCSMTFEKDQPNPITPFIAAVAKNCFFSMWMQIKLMAYPEEAIERGYKRIKLMCQAGQKINNPAGLLMKIVHTETQSLGVAPNNVLKLELQDYYKMPADAVDLLPDYSFEEMQKAIASTAVPKAVKVATKAQPTQGYSPKSFQKNSSNGTAEAISSLTNAAMRKPWTSTHRLEVPQEDPVMAFHKIEAHYQKNKAACLAVNGFNPWADAAREAGEDVDTFMKHRYTFWKEELLKAVQAIPQPPKSPSYFKDDAFTAQPPSDDTPYTNYDGYSSSEWDEVL